MFKPLISICIPAYNKPQFVARCLDSIAQQDYPNIEVIISDDSPGEDIKTIIKPYSEKLNIRYYHNQPALRSPGNWNAALDKGSGGLLMLLHQDDWLHAADAISTYVQTFEKAPEADFVFCRNTAVDATGNEMVLQAKPELLTELEEKPNHLLLAPVIGPPSNVMLRASLSVRYDEQFIWLVDIDYYVRLLKAGHGYRYIDRHLVSIGVHEDQTTAYVRSNEHIMLKENILFAGKLEKTAFRDILVYDYFWRLLRNFKVRSVNELKVEKIPEVIKHMIALQKKMPGSLLKFGVSSKLLMFLSYITKPAA